MFFGYFLCILFLASQIYAAAIDEIPSTQNDLIDSNFSNDALNDNVYDVVNYQNPQKQTTWWQTARDTLAGPAGQIAVHVAKEMISRSTGNSQVLSLNVTNLLILVLLKALIFSAGLLGAGNWGQYARARQFDAPLILDEEAPLFVGFLALEGSGEQNCLNRAACRSPEIASDYVKAAKAVIQGVQMFDQQINATLYVRTIDGLERSIVDGINGISCNAIYPCRL